MTKRLLTAGVLGTSRKENEHRLPIHPDHFDRVPAECRPGLRFETGYGRAFGVDEERLRAFSGGEPWPRERLLADCDVVILPKPLTEDLRELREGGILWGWPHCVQQEEMTQAAIDRRQTLIAFEAMFQWSSNGQRGLHLFYKNNELAGYCAVLHALELEGLDGYYGKERAAVLLGFGSTSRGAAYALQGRGIQDLTILTQRPTHLVKDQLPGARYLQMRRTENGLEAVAADGSARPLVEVLAAADLVVNGTLQDTDRPLMFLREGEVRSLRPGCLIVDVSCDEGMGFPFARPTSFESPIFKAAPATYYAVDHTPSYLWDASTWEVSEALLPYLECVLSGPDAWQEEPTIDRAIEIHDGTVRNDKILSFQNREDDYPHPIRSS
jgi:alanine dehydrogenase